MRFALCDADDDCCAAGHEEVTMAATSKHTGINDNMSLVAAGILIPLILFIAYKLYAMLKEESDAEAEKAAKREAKKAGRKGSKKE